MANTSYLTLTGAKQSDIKGDCVQEAYKDSITVYAVDHEVHIPRDTHTGLATGQRVHGPFSITKHKDLSSPKLYQALTSGEQITKWELSYTAIGTSGNEYIYAKVQLENAIIVSIKSYKPMTFLKENEPYHDMEEIMFTYGKITWISLDEKGSTLAQTDDDWKKPKA
jgi:type VI secretion system secreted protein Hcp